MRELSYLVDVETNEKIAVLTEVKPQMTDEQYRELCVRREKRMQYFLDKMSEREVR